MTHLVGKLFLLKILLTHYKDAYPNVELQIHYVLFSSTLSQLYEEAVYINKSLSSNN